MKIYDLLYAEKKNETEALNEKKRHWPLFLFSLLLLLSEGFCFMEGCFNDALVEMGMAGITLLTGTLLLIAGIYGTYISVPAFLSKAILSNPVRKYRKNHLFLTRNLTARLRKTGMALGTLALLITLTLTATQLGVLFKKFWEIKTEQTATFDVGIAWPKENGNLEETKALIEADAGPFESHTYPVRFCYIFLFPILYRADFRLCSRDHTGCTAVK